MSESKIEVVVSSREGTRAGQSVTLTTQQFASNVKEFVQKMSEVLAAIPKTTDDNFELSEFVVSAEMSRAGALKLSGSGVEASTSGSITFKFTKKTR